MRLKGFSLIELILTITVFTLLIGISIPILNNYLSNNNLNNSLYITSNALRRAKDLSINQYYDSNWGIYIENGMLTLYSGDSYNLRDQSLDEQYSFPVGIETSGNNEVNFSKSTGYLNTPKNIILTSPNDISVVIEISEYGNFIYQ